MTVMTVMTMMAMMAMMPVIDVMSVMSVVSVMISSPVDIDDDVRLSIGLIVVIEALRFYIRECLRW